LNFALKVSSNMFLLSLLLACCAAVSLGFTADDRKDCTEIQANGLGYKPPSGRYNLLVGDGRRARWVYCDMDTDGGGWTLIQKRTSASLNFYQDWKSYEMGFGAVTGDHWLGLSYIHSITVNKRYRLRIEYTDWKDNLHYAEYDDFRIGGAGCNYTLDSLGNYCGDCGDSLRVHLGAEFSTYDYDNDQAVFSCAVKHKGGWWYKACYQSNLNGEYKNGGSSPAQDGISWFTCGDYNYSYKTTKMMIRPFYF
jgi:hypothetical protein